MTREEYIAGAQERGIPMETIRKVLVSKFGQKDGIGTNPNSLGRALFPRASSVMDKQALGQSVNLDERIGNVGEIGANIVPFLPLPIPFTVKMALAGAIRGLTEPGQDITGRLKGGVTDAAISSAVPLAFKTLFSPTSIIGPLRSLSLGSKTVPTATLEKEASRNLLGNTGYTQAISNVKRMASNELGKFFTNLNPLGEKATQAIQTPIKKVYEHLSAFEKARGAYKGGTDVASTAIGQSGRLASGAVRNYLTGEVNPLTRVLNTAYGPAATMEGFTRKFWPVGAAGTASTAVVYNLINSLLNKK